MSFFVNAGIRFVTELCKMRAFTDLWDELLETRYGITDAKFRRFRYGVQVNSLGLTEQQPENNVYRILIEMLAVTLSKNARARAVQLPAWNEALGLPRPFDQQWSLRMQQILAYETDLLEYDDLFDGNPAIDRKVDALKAGRAGGTRPYRRDGRGRRRHRLHEGPPGRSPTPNASARIETRRNDRRRRQPLHHHRTLAPRPPAKARSCRPTPRPRPTRCARLTSGAASATPKRSHEALAALRQAAQTGENIMPASILRAKAGRHHRRMGRRDARALRRIPRADRRQPEPLEPHRRAGAGPRCRRRRCRQAWAHPSRLLLGKPGLDGHSNGAEQIAARARDCGMEITYDGIRLTPAEIVAAAVEQAAGCHRPVHPVRQPPAR